MGLGGGGVLGFWWLRVCRALGVGFGGLGFQGDKKGFRLCSER